MLSAQDEEQGRLLSSLLFNTVPEFMAISPEKEIKSIEFGKEELRPFADDTVIYAENFQGIYKNTCLT